MNTKKHQVYNAIISENEYPQYDKSNVNNHMSKTNGDKAKHDTHTYNSLKSKKQDIVKANHDETSFLS